jgi:hypothetical protein
MSIGSGWHHSLAALSESDLDHASGNDRSSKRGTEEVDVLVDGVALNGGVDELLDKLSLEVLEEEARGSALHGLGSSGLKVLLLTDIGHEGNDLVSLLDEPEEDARGV